MGVIEHSIIFNDEISESTVQDLIDKMSQYSFVNLYFSTDGGEIHSMRILIEYLNRRAEDDTVRVFLGTYVVSAGTYFLTDYNGPLYINSSFRYFMFHAPDMMLYTLRGDKEMKEKLHKFLTEDNEAYYNKLIEIGLTKKEVQKIRAGDDIYIYRDDLSRLRRKFVLSEAVIKDYTIYN